MLPILNLGFKTQEPKRIPHFAKDVEEWYSALLAEEKLTAPISDKLLLDRFMRQFYPDTSYKAKIVARQEGCILIEVFRWLEATKQAMSNHLWMISQGGVDCIKIS